MKFVKLYRLLSTKLMGRAAARLLLSFIVLVILVTIITIYLRDNSELTQRRRRPKTVIKFLNKDLCAITSPDSGKTAVIIVHSARSHFERRTLIRQTYGTIYNVNNIRILAVVFMLGSSDGDLNTPTDTTKLQMEMDRYRDIIVGDFVDHYRNLTLKAIMAFEWLTTHCRQARFLIKTDDDVVINIYRLTKEMDSWTEEEVNSQNIWCPLHRNERTVDNKMSRFYASPVDFPNGIFPDHCGGLGWVTNIDVIDQFVDAISRWFLGRVCTHDDVFMTGILVRHINIMRNSSRGKIEPIKLVDRYGKWISLALEDGRGDEDYFLRNLMERPPDDAETDSLVEFQQRYENKTFYLIWHDEKFRFNYLWLWKMIEKCFGE